MKKADPKRRTTKKGEYRTYYLSYASIELLEKVGNKSEYIDNLIANNPPKKGR